MREGWGRYGTMREGWGRYGTMREGWVEHHEGGVG